ncbi:MAG: phosphorylase family protein [Acetobacter cibinongensis]
MTPAHSAPTKPGILVGLKAEAKFIRHIFPHAAIAASGATRTGAQREAARLAACGADCLLSFGLAAGLDPALPAGTLIVPEAVQAWGTRYRCDPTLRHILGGTQPATLGGTLLHSDHVVLTAEEKARLFAESGCAALDMESGFLARTAEEAGLPFAVLRVVCDPATRTLPPVAATVLSPDGGLNIGALAGSLLRKPTQIPALIALGRDAGKARTAMQTFLTQQRTLRAFIRLAEG